jgi:flagellar FliJ protein
MSRFKFRLATLQKLREATRNERRAELTRAADAQRVLQEQQRQVADEVAGMRDEIHRGSLPGWVNVDELTSAHRYRLVLEVQEHVLRQRAEEVAAEVERRRQALVEADRQVKVLDKLREKLRERHLRGEAAADQKETDEIARLGALREAD